MAAIKKKATKGKAASSKAVSTKVSAKKAAGRKSAEKVAAPKAARSQAAPRKKAAPRAAGSTAGDPAPRAAALHPAARRAAARRARATAEQPSLVELTRLLRDRMTSRVPSDYVRGKTRLRDEVMALLSCSPARAEHIVDSMVARGYARFGRHPRFTTDPRFGIWHLDDTP